MSVEFKQDYKGLFFGLNTSPDEVLLFKMGGEQIEADYSKTGESCDNFSYRLTMPPQHGFYKLKVVVGENTFEHPFNTYWIFVDEFIAQMENVICECCNSCSGHSDCNDLVKLSTLTQFLNGIFQPVIGYSVNNSFGEVEKKLYALQLKCVQKSIVQGDYKNSDEVIKIISSVLYLNLLKYYESTFTESETESKFKKSKITDCIKSLCFDLDAVKNKIDTMAKLHISSAPYENQPPSNIDSYSLSIGNRIEKTLTAQMFTNNYQDPENDPPFKIKINSLPTSGTLLFEGNPVSVGNEISIADIEEGKLSYKSPDQNNVSDIDIDFSITDQNSGQYIS